MAILPILQFEEQILETVERNPVAVIIGETGSGKSTQLSQMLHKRGYTKSGLIAVTQPRRVAAVSVSRWLPQASIDHDWDKQPLSMIGMKTKLLHLWLAQSIETSYA
ncbi:probable pre-mRNA-splicing factor ATP-dependent RNA helicase DEAH4 [Cornus florida]|uniref:probable pre-mRNA-splicing factor ATP-dependent RNA helicase DEAH4 n=1 Tax=Cornus florida TaxID=4283 RepID=UPI0028A2A518|nr:probable pre-mRNA-splicing factor ATP-dependent RNA helicase DEAH4 [Cornus florida]